MIHHHDNTSQVRTFLFHLSLLLPPHLQIWKGVGALQSETVLREIEKEEYKNYLKKRKGSPSQTSPSLNSDFATMLPDLNVYFILYWFSFLTFL